MLRDEIRIDFVVGDAIQGAVVGMGIYPPQTGIPHVCDPRTETVSQQPEKTKHHIRVGSRIRHDFSWVQLRLLFQYDSEQDEAVTKRAGNHDTIQAGELIRDEIVISHAAAHAKIFGIRTGMNGSDGDDEP